MRSDSDERQACRRAGGNKVQFCGFFIEKRFNGWMPVSVNVLNRYVSYPVLEQQTGGSAIGTDSYELLIANPVEGFGLLKDFGNRSMVSKGISYPHWENRARAYEDVSALFLALELLFLCYPVCVLGWGIRGLWKRRGKAKGFLRSRFLFYIQN